MTRSHPKRLYALIALFALLLVASAALAVYYFDDGAYGGAYRRAKIDFSVSLEDSLLLSEEGARSLSEGQYELVIANGEKKKASFVIYQSGVELASVSLDGREEGTVTVLVPAEAPLSLLIRGEKKDTAYLSDPLSAECISSVMERGGDLVFVENCALDTLSLSAPFRLFGDFSFGELAVENEGNDPLVLSPDTPFTGTLFVNTPSAPLYYRDFTPSFPKEEEDFYLKAQSCNSHRLHPSSFPVSSEENLVRLWDDALLPRFSENAEISFIKEFTLTQPLSFTGAVKLDFCVPVRFENANLSFTSEKKADFTVRTVTGSGVLCADLVFDAPTSSLTWEGEGEVPAISSVAKQNNLAFYNGAALPLGGEGCAVPNLVLPAEENSFLEEDVVFLVNGNSLEGVFPYDVAKSDLKDAVFSLSADGGTARLEGTLADGTIVTTDGNGKERSFGITLLRDGYNIPVVYLETEDGVEITSKSQYVNATFSMDGVDSEYDDRKETSIRIRGRGNSSWKWEKKPYKIHFAEPTSLLGLPAAEEWALFSNYADKSLFRNRLAQVMASTLSFDYDPTHVCVDVFLNGEYLGVYTLGEHLEEGEGRVEVDHDMSSVDCGYFLEAGGVVSGVDVKGMNYFHAGLVKFVLVKGPEYNTLTSEQFAFIKEYMMAANDAVVSGEGYEEYLDMDTVVDWLIMIELSNNTDCAWRRSTYFTKNPGEKLKMGPVWDFDLAFGNFSKDDKDYDTWASSTEDDYVGETWTTHLIEDPEFRALFKARWEEVKDTLLETAMAEIDASYERLLPSALENFKRWDILGRKVAFEPQSTSRYPTYESQIQYLKDFLEERSAWITSQVENW